MPVPGRAAVAQLVRAPLSATSAGLLVHRRGGRGIEVLLVHPGGPYWARRDAGAWSIPKGEVDDGEDPLGAAQREFREELGLAPPSGPFVELGTVRQKAGKTVHAWAVEGDLDVAAIAGATIEIEWPPRSGQRRSFPEIDRAAWCTPDEARRLLIEAQVAFIERLAAALAR